MRNYGWDYKNHRTTSTIHEAMSEQKHTPTTIEGIRRDIQVTLRLKGILGPNYEQWLCKFDNGIEIDIIDLLIEERLKGSPELLQQVAELEAERSEVIRRIKSILKASTVHDKISILEELEQLLNSLKK